MKRLRISQETRVAYLFLIPAIVFFALFMFYPIGYVFSMAFYKTNKLGILQEWAGFSNFVENMSKPEFWQITFRSFLWTFLAVAVKTVLGMIIALSLNVQFFARKIARMLFIIPWASSVPISAMLWKWVLDHEFGLLNHTLVALGITSSPPVWLGEPISSFISCLWVDIWIGIPFMALVFLAGMQSVSRDIYESASVDGVSASKQLFLIYPASITAKEALMTPHPASSWWTFNDFTLIESDVLLARQALISGLDIRTHTNGWWTKSRNAEMLYGYSPLFCCCFSASAMPSSTSGGMIRYDGQQ